MLNLALVVGGIVSVTGPECDWKLYCPCGSSGPTKSTSPLTEDTSMSFETTLTSSTLPLVDSALTEPPCTSVSVTVPFNDVASTLPRIRSPVRSPDRVTISTRPFASMTSTSPLLVCRSTAPLTPRTVRLPFMLRRMTRVPSGTVTSYSVSPVRPR